MIIWIVEFCGWFVCKIINVSLGDSFRRVGFLAWGGDDSIILFRFFGIFVFFFVLDFMEIGIRLRVVRINK